MYGIGCKNRENSFEFTYPNKEKITDTDVYSSNFDNRPAINLSTSDIGRRTIYNAQTNDINCMLEMLNRARNRGGQSHE